MSDKAKYDRTAFDIINGPVTNKKLEKMSLAELEQEMGKLEELGKLIKKYEKELKEREQKK